MSDWKSVLKADPTDWLLEKTNPSVRYFALSQILDKPRSSSEVQEAKKEIMLDGVVPKILAKQNDGGYWEAPDKFYTAKYKGTVWQLIILAELGADGQDARVKKACEFILENSQDRKSGGFSAWLSVKVGGGRYSGVLPCLTGNMVWSLIRLGFLDDPRVNRGIDWIVKYQRFDDGEAYPPKIWPYEKATSCFGKHSCHMGVVKALKALAEIPDAKRSAGVIGTIERGVEYMLKHHIYKRSHNLSKLSKPGWLRLGFPLMYQTDVLEILGILTSLGYKDPRMQETIDVILSKQDENGTWKLENTFNGRFQTSIEQRGNRSKWITLNALRALKNFYE
ncbi:nitrogen fixation protein NifH [Candidatus Bathyarchaeota archaeon]|nr:nitrogen fixation protein NifH [Candidatus Bathyarchaeota archaeon]